eukprot:3145214-Pleurochrysis_carterae.AAC.1
MARHCSPAKQRRQQQLGVLQAQSMLTTGSRMLITYTSACMQPKYIAMRALAYDMNGIIYVNDCECSGATRAPHYVEQMTEQIQPAHAIVD